MAAESVKENMLTRDLSMNKIKKILTKKILKSYMKYIRLDGKIIGR